MTQTDLRNQLDVLRARVESELTVPAVLVVTSAKKGDGKSLVAHGLADTFADAGYRVLLVDANAANPQIPELPKVARLQRNLEDSVYPTRRLGSYDALSLTDPRITSSTARDVVETTAAYFRTQYDVTIIDGAAATSNTLALLFAACADATLLTLRVGRKADRDDAAAVQALERIGARVMGLVTTTRDAAKTFERRERETPRAVEPVVRPALPFVETVRSDERSLPANHASANAS